MLASCERAAQLGLPSIAFTEHADLTPWVTAPHEVPLLPPHLRGWLRPDGVLTAPELDVDGYLRSVARCRERFPGLRVLSGVELSEPHWHPERTATLLATATFDCVLGSVHTIRHYDDGGDRPVELALADGCPVEVVEAYLAEVLRMVSSDAPFAVLAHVDYPVRSWPASAGPFRPEIVEEGFRQVLEVLACSGRALEINTKVPFAPVLVRWWADAGGDAVSFGSDAHRPAAVGHGFDDAAATARSYGFRPGADSSDLWPRRRPAVSALP
jgi:histidinol-phosphatase (PHP family)